MLVMLSPEFSGSELQITQLVQVTGLLPYDLRTRLRPGTWGVLRVIADNDQALALVTRLTSLGFQAVAIDSAIGQDPERKVVYLRGLDVTEHGMTLRLSERQMFVPFGALLTIVRGEVHLGRSQRGNTLGALAGQLRSTPQLGPWAGGMAGENVAIGDGRNPGVTDVFAAADLHFITVPCIARIDARDMEFPSIVPPQTNAAERLDYLVDWLANRSQVRVDRHLRISSLSSHTIASRGVASTPQGSVPPPRRAGSSASDEHFDAYSRLVAEAERVQRSHAPQ
jgi:hypothetical protein